MDRTTAYRFTATSTDDPRIKELKAEIAAYNKVVRAEVRAGNAAIKYWNNEKKYLPEMVLLRVRLMPRGPRKEAAMQDYPNRVWRDKVTGSTRNSAYDAYLPARYGTHFDVYVNTDSTSNYMLGREMETGLTPGQLARLDREQTAMWQAKFEMEQRLRDAGIYSSGDNYVSKEVKKAEMRANGMPELFIERLG